MSLVCTDPLTIAGDMRNLAEKLFGIADDLEEAAAEYGDESDTESDTESGTESDIDLEIKAARKRLERLSLGNFEEILDSAKEVSSDLLETVFHLGSAREIVRASLYSDPGATRGSEDLEGSKE